MLMGAIQMKHVPDELHDAIRTRARSRGLTVRDYLLDVVRRDLARPTKEEWFARLDELEPVEGVDTAALIREIRDEHDEEIGRRVMDRR
jgi:hypothetical protein